MTRLSRFLKDESGVTAIEYALIAGGIGLAIIVVVHDVGAAIVTTFQSVQSAF